VAVVGALWAMLAPACLAAQGHDVRTYRVLQHLALDAGQDGAFVLACRRGDLATDGTWRVDGLDDAGADPVSGVDVLEADSISPQSYRFDVRNTTVAAARLTIAVSCLDGDVGSGSDRHRLGVGSRRSATGDVAAGAVRAPMVACPSGSVAVAPGFRLAGGAGAVARVVTRLPAGGVTRVDLRLVALSGLRVTASTRCLARMTTRSPRDGHRHRLRLALRGAMATVADGRRESFTVACRADERAIEGGFSLSEAWYLGQVPSGRRRSYVLQSPATGRPASATLSLLCLGTRTSIPLTPRAAIVRRRLRDVAAGTLLADPRPAW
jgi:hypothetical protein